MMGYQSRKETFEKKGHRDEKRRDLKEEKRKKEKCRVGQKKPTLWVLIRSNFSRIVEGEVVGPQCLQARLDDQYANRIFHSVDM